MTMDLENDTRTHLQRLEEKRQELMKKLKESMAIRDLWPEAFRHGTTMSSLTGNLLSGAVKFRITAGDGMHKDFELKDVPPVLLRRHYEAAIKDAPIWRRIRWRQIFKRYLEDI